jgi:hypothetical protein
VTEDKEGTLLVLLEYDAIRVLSTCKFLEQRPAGTNSSEYDFKSSTRLPTASSSSSMALMALSSSASTPASSAAASSLLLPSATQRYHQLLIPALRLIVSCLASAPDNITLHKHTLEFTKAQDETVKSILLDASKPVYLSTLNALKLITATYYFLYAGPCYTRDPAQDRRTEITRHEKILIKLLARYAEPHQSARLRSLMGASASSGSALDLGSSTATTSSATATEFEFDGDTADDLCDEIVRNLIAALVVKTLKDSSPPPNVVSVGPSVSVVAPLPVMGHRLRLRPRYQFVLVAWYY